VDTYVSIHVNDEFIKNLKEQKNWLINHQSDSHGDFDIVEGILGLFDSIQDNLVDGQGYPEDEIFDLVSERGEDPNTITAEITYILNSEGDTRTETVEIPDFLLQNENDINLPGVKEKLIKYFEDDSGYPVESIEI
jgi:hypothetical protein